MDIIKIENEIKKKCPNCDFVFAIENDHEVLYKNIMMLYFNSDTGLAQIKCRHCKIMITVSIEKGKAMIAE